jgi:hypothetical protein
MVNKNVLSIKDLKSILNIVKKTSKKKKRRNKKRLTNNNNVRSSSLQMIPSNVNNLQSENLLLQNKQLENNLIKNKEKQADNQLVVANNNNDYTSLNDKIDMMQSQGNRLFSDLYSRSKTKSNLSTNKSKNMDSSNMKVDLTDSIDVPSTGGDDIFEAKETPTKSPIIEEVISSTPDVKFDKVYDSELKSDVIPAMTNSTKTDAGKLLIRKKLFTDLSLELGLVPNSTILSKSVSTINKEIVKLRNKKENQKKK